MPITLPFERERETEKKETLDYVALYHNSARPPRRVSLSGGRKIAPSSAHAEYSDLMKEEMLDKAVDLIAAAREGSANGRLQRVTVADILTSLPSSFTRDMLYS